MKTVCLSLIAEGDIGGYLCGVDCIGLMIGCIGVMIFGIFGVYVAIKEHELRTRGLTTYKKSLQQLKDNPNDPQVRERTLELGRAYSKLSIEGVKERIFDEVAFKNDIDAACAGAVNIQKRSVEEEKPSVEERLAKLKKLHASGHITDDEYRSRRKSILDDV